MSDTEKSARPRQLTVAGGFVIGGSVLLVLTVFDTLTRLNSVDTRESVVTWVGTPLAETLGLGVSESLSVWRAVMMVAAACAAAAAVLGAYALQRNRTARLALSVLAVPLLLTAPLTGGLTGAVVAAATLMMWSGPARDWFAGRPIREAGRPAPPSRPAGPWERSMPSPEDRRQEPEAHPPAADQRGPQGEPGSQSPSELGTPPASSLTTSAPATQPQAWAGFGERPAGPPDPAEQAWRPSSHTHVTATGVPATVKIACVLTWVFSGLVALLYAAMLVVLVAAQDRIVDAVLDSPEWQRTDLDSGVLVPVLWFGCLMFLGWALGACVLAWFTWRRHNWARWLLATSAAVALLAGFVAFPVGILHQVAAVLTITGLFGAGARAWFADQPWTPGPPPGGPPTLTPPSHTPPSHTPPSHTPPPPSEGKPPVW
jgi:hypothetical protein